MSSVLYKRTAIVELFKARNSRWDISKSVKINRMLVWRTLKRYEETGDIQNRPGQGRPRTDGTSKLVKSTRKKIRRNPKTFIQNLAKNLNVSYGTCKLFSGRIWRCPSFNHVKKHQFLLKLLTNDSQRCKMLLSRIQDGTLPNFVFSDKKKLNVEHRCNNQNDRV